MKKWIISTSGLVGVGIILAIYAGATYNRMCGAVGLVALLTGAVCCMVSYEKGM